MSSADIKNGATRSIIANGSCTHLSGDDIDQLAASLADCATPLVGWRVGSADRVTVRTLRMLAAWALESTDRGVGVVISRAANGRQPMAAAGTIAMFGDASNAAMCEAQVRRLVASADVLMISGHGDERIVMLPAGGWLAAKSDKVGLSGNYFLGPEGVHAQLVFLNTCSSLRLGDSVVPSDHNLALSLHRAGVAVIGAHRNVNPPADACALVECELGRSTPAGVIVNRLNQRLAERGEPPAYALLGDPGLIVRCQPRLAPRVRPPELPGADSLDCSIDDVEALLNLASASQRWDEDFFHTWATYKPLNEVYKMLVRLRHRSVRASFDAEQDCALLHELTRQRVRATLLGLLRDLVRPIQSGRWMQGWVAPAMRPPRIATGSCPRCEEHLIFLRHDPWTSGFPFFETHECDRCGTVCDFAATDRDTDTAFTVTMDGDRIRLQIPAARDGELRVLVLHREPNYVPVHLSCSRQSLALPAQRSSALGKCTFALLAVSCRRIHVTYQTLFVPSAIT